MAAAQPRRPSKLNSLVSLCSEKQSNCLDKKLKNVKSNEEEQAQLQTIAKARGTAVKNAGEQFDKLDINGDGDFE